VISRSTIQLLRFHFSFFLLPVFLFALSQAIAINWQHALLAFFILHLLVYPSSNGYNSYMDRDEFSIGGLKNPLQPTQQLFWVTLGMDVLAVGLSFFISAIFAAGVLLYILASRAYSYRSIRLKKFPVAGYLTVVLFQGVEVFFLSYYAASLHKTFAVPLWPMLAAGLLIGGYYPLTQVYQHEADKKDGVSTISMLLGVRGTFVFCGCIFAAATLMMFATFYQQQKLQYFFVFIACMLPMVLFFLWWMKKTWNNSNAADFKNSLVMNVLASACTSICFLIILIWKTVE